jgi:predicted enzyme related to lactoylglutathione lyase
MIKSIGVVSIWSEDLNNLLPFYRDVVGLAAAPGGPGFVVLSGSEGPAVALGTHSDVHGKNMDPARHIISLNVDDCAGEYERLKAKGVDFIEGPNRPVPQAPMIATFRDPEGNLIQLAQF